jgi:hypothetical protein
MFRDSNDYMQHVATCGKVSETNHVERQDRKPDLIQTSNTNDAEQPETDEMQFVDENMVTPDSFPNTVEPPRRGRPPKFKS